MVSASGRPQERAEPLSSAAQRIARRGNPVFPCNPEDKRPLTSNGFKDATTDERKVTRWWNSRPDALIGMPTGPRTRITVVDVDLGKTGSDDPRAREEGRGAAAWWQENQAQFASAPLVETRSGGLHVYCRYTPGDRNTQGGIHKGVDRRGEGGYVIVPPSPGYRLIRRAGKQATWPTAPGNASGRGQLGLPKYGVDMADPFRLTDEAADGLATALHHIFIEPHELHINAQRIAFALAYWIGAPLGTVDRFLHAALLCIRRAGLIDHAMYHKHWTRLSRIAAWYAAKRDEERHPEILALIEASRARTVVDAIRTATAEELEGLTCLIEARRKEME